MWSTRILRTQILALAVPVTHSRNAEWSNGFSRVHPDQRHLTVGVRQRSLSRLNSSHFYHNTVGSQGILTEPLPRDSHEQDVNHAGPAAWAENPQEASHEYFDNESAPGPDRGREKKRNVFEGGAWMVPLRIAFGLLIAVACAFTVPPRASAAERGSNGAGMSKVAVAEQGAPENAQQFEIKVMKERTGQATSAGGQAVVGIEVDESRDLEDPQDIAENEAKILATLRYTWEAHLTEYQALVQAGELRGHHTRFKLPESLSKKEYLGLQLSTMVLANRRLVEDQALLDEFQRNIDTYLTSLTKALALCSKNGFQPSQIDPSKDAQAQAAELGARIDMVKSGLGEALREHDKNQSLLRLYTVQYKMLQTMRMVEEDASIRFIWRRSEDHEMIAKAQVVLQKIEKGLQSVDNMRTAILLGARKIIVHDQRISRESVLLLRMLAGGHQLRLLAFEFKRAAADVGEVSNALFQSRQICIEACKDAQEASERPPTGTWEAIEKHFAELEDIEALCLLTQSQLYDALQSLQMADR